MKHRNKFKRVAGARVIVFNTISGVIFDYFWEGILIIINSVKIGGNFFFVSPIFLEKCSSLRKSGRYDNRISFILCFDIGQSGG